MTAVKLIRRCASNRRRNSYCDSYRSAICFAIYGVGTQTSRLLPRLIAVIRTRLTPPREISGPLYGFGKLCAPQCPQFSFHFSVGINEPSRVCSPDLSDSEDSIMLRWALIFFVVALLAAVLGFTGIAIAAAGVAKILFYIFVILFVLSLLGHVARRP
jgi:uncharacterized membrane protein YtjA (UPF0391 family)